MFLITFHRNIDATLFSRKAKQWGSVSMRPVPRKLSSSCGTYIVFEIESEDLPVEEISQLSFEKLFKVIKDGEEYELLLENE